ncbi:MAG: hypothetical protein ABSG74_01970 [Candidatus Bathyarchaeia archaeon]|jgi:hypothetical protein
MTVEEIQVGLEYIAEKHGISPRELWATAEKLRAEQRDADYRREFATQAHMRELIEKNKQWILELEDRPLKDALVLMESGGVIPVEKFVCSGCKGKLLVGDGGKMFIRGKYLGRNFSVETKEELERMIKADLLDGKSSTYMDCPKCHNSTANFRMTPTPK